MSATVEPTLERDERGWFVRCMCPDGVVRRVGPFEAKGAAWSFLLRVAGML